MRRIVTLLLIAIPLMAGAQRTAVMSDLLAMSSHSMSPVAKTKMDKFFRELNPSGNPSLPLLRRTFHHVQKTFLHSYSPYSRLDEVFSSGSYDCLTATALFAAVLDELNFDYQIVETNYHIFLLVRTPQEEVLLETTDRLGGFIRGKMAISERINSYRNIEADNRDPGRYHYTFNLCHNVSIHQLPGLLFYNQAVKAYNAGELEGCANLLAKAQSIYDTPRINEFVAVLIKTVADSNLDSATKEQILKQFSVKSTVLAAR